MSKKKPVDHAKEWKAWVKQLKKYLTHETPVFVEAEKGALLPAVIIEINFKQWDVKIRLDSDTCTKPGFKSVPNSGGWGYGMEPEPEYVSVWDEAIPVKEDWVHYKHLKFIDKTKKKNE